MVPHEPGGDEFRNDSDALRKVLDEYLAVPGVVGAAFVSDEGLVISQAVPEDVDADVIAVFAADVAVACQRLGESARAESIKSVQIEFERGQVWLVPFASGVSLLLLLDQSGAGKTGERLWEKRDLKLRGGSLELQGGTPAADQEAEN
ncbi:MAG: roadblock/LC7 domain-containing protein [Thermoleophilia bacterium]|nr:roadblock/LC7 domain-containing protein [Thermoleophilia bacterium]